jgi:hypothetical protein
LKIILALFLAFTILFPTIGKLGIFITFKINQEYIAKNLCEQRNIKNNKCHGCCQLKKKLAENDKQEQKQMPRGSNEKSSLSFDYFCRELSGLSCNFSVEEVNFNTYSSFLPASHIGSVFRPPKG